MSNASLMLTIVAVAFLSCSRIGAAGESQTVSVSLGADEFCPTPDHPVGWLGDFTARFPGAHDLVLEWDTTTGHNILWKTVLPNWGHSAPIRVGDRLFITCEPDTTVCLDAGTGAILWQKAAKGPNAREGFYHNATGWSMQTPCSDGKHLYVHHGNGVVMSYDFDGNVRWRKEVPFKENDGSSPVLMDGKFIVLHGDSGPKDNPRNMSAFSAEDGTLAWEASKPFLYATWEYHSIVPVCIANTPYVFNHCGQFWNVRNGSLITQVVTGDFYTAAWIPSVSEDSTIVLAYRVDCAKKQRKGADPICRPQANLKDLKEPAGKAESDARAGKVKADVAAGKSKGTPLGLDDWILLPVSVRPDESGGLQFEASTRPTLVRGNGEFPHFLTSKGFIYWMGDGKGKGQRSQTAVTAISLMTGEAVGPWGYDGLVVKPPEPNLNPRIDCNFFYAHSVVAGDHLFVTDTGGWTYVFTLAPDLRLIGVNVAMTEKVPGGSNVAGWKESSLFFHGNRQYHRNWDTLFCIGDPKEKDRAEAFAAAKALAKGGKVKEALAAYRALWKDDAKHVRYRAIREMNTVLGVDAADEVRLALQHVDDPPISTTVRKRPVAEVKKSTGDNVKPDAKADELPIPQIDLGL